MIEESYWSEGPDCAARLARLLALVERPVSAGSLATRPISSGTVVLEALVERRGHPHQLQWLVTVALRSPDAGLVLFALPWSDAVRFTVAMASRAAT